MNKTKIFIADDHRVVIEGIKSTLKEYPEFEVVGEALNGHDAVKQVLATKPDIVIMDIAMPNLNGMDAALQIKRSGYDIKIIIFTMYSDKEYVVNLFKAGISAYVLKEDPMSDLILAIRAVNGGGTYFSTMAPKVILSYMKNLEEGTGPDNFKKLSLREREIFQLLAEGKSIKDIATQLGIDAKTVQSHKYNIFEKLHVKTLTDLIRIAVRKKVIHL